MIVLPSKSDGQVGNLLRNKMGKAINAGARTLNKEVDNQIDTAATKETQKAIDREKEKAAAKAASDTLNDSGQPSKADNINSGNTGDSGDTGTSGNQAPKGGMNFGKLFANKITLKYNEDYSFSSRIYMYIETYDKNDSMKMDYYMFYSATSPCIGVETKTISNDENGSVPLTTSMVMDGENKCVIALTEVNGMKMGMISEISDSTAANDGKKGKKSTPPTFTKTGNTRVIVGYTCDEYTYINNDDKTTGKVWFTKDAKLRIDKKGWRNSGMATYYGNPDFKDGVILANEAYNDKGKLTMKSETKEINENFPHSISIKGYTLRQVNMNNSKK